MRTRTHPRRTAGAVGATLALVISACGSDSPAADSPAADSPAADSPAADSTVASVAAPTSSSATTTDAATATSAATAGGDPSAEADTTAGVKAAQWSSNVTISYTDGNFQFVSNGLPSHELADQYLVPGGDFTPPVDASEVTAFNAADVVTETPLDVSIPLNPVYSDTVTDTNLGMIGVVISGAQMFNDYEDPTRTFVAVDDNFTIDGVSFVDSCNGHPLALNVGGGNYHYHGVPYCITDGIDVAGEHSHVLGFLLDGFPLYGPQDTDGSTLVTGDLDECNGHVGPTPEFPNGIYHYHLKEDQSPYTPDCYHGEVTVAGNGGGPPGGGPPGGGPPGGGPPGGGPPGSGVPPGSTGG